MKKAPPLQDGEEVLFDHVPSLRAFKRTALLMLALTLPAVVAFSVVFPDTIWPAVPLFVACVLLMQERFTLGRHRAWITNRRIILQNSEVALADITSVIPKSVYVQVHHSDGAKKLPLYYPKDGPAMAAIIKSASQGGSDAE